MQILWLYHVSFGIFLGLSLHVALLPPLALGNLPANVKFERREQHYGTILIKILYRSSIGLRGGGVFASLFSTQRTRGGLPLVH